MKAIMGDMIEVFKIMHGWENVHECDFFKRDQT